MTAPKLRECKDCWAEAQQTGRSVLRRPAPHPGPRCATHHKQEQRRRRLAAKQRHVQRTYNLPPELYDKLYEAQGGRCALCRRATGASKRLAVDHDHACCIGPTSCGKCVRGLVCGPCNDVLAHFRDDVGAVLRMAAYLREWPSVKAGVVSRRTRLEVQAGAIGHRERLVDESVGGDFTYG